MEESQKIGMLENFLKQHQNSFKSLFQRKRSSNSGEDVTCDSPALSPRAIPQLSAIANSVVARCSKILGIPTHELQHHYDIELPESVEQLFTYARNFLEFCSYQATNSLTTRPNYLSDKDFRRLTYDMMLAWETPSVETQSPQNAETASPSNQEEEDEDGGSFFYATSTDLAVQVDGTRTVGKEAFIRIAPACVAIADIMTAHNLFDALTSSAGNRLHFLIYDKYIHCLDKIIKAAKNAPGPLISNLQLAEGEIILDFDGTVPTQPILQHIGISAWPGRLTLTTNALYFESLGVGLYDKAVRYDLANDMKQVIKPELTGPLGARLFDKAVMYKSASVVEPVYFEFPEFKGNSRRDYWLDICIEILDAHKYIRKNKFKEPQRLEVLGRVTLSIFRCHAVREAFQFFASSYKTLLPFKLAESLPRGDMILEALSNRLALIDTTTSPRNVDEFMNSKQKPKLSPTAVLSLAQLGLTLQNDLKLDGEPLMMGDLSAGEINSLEMAVKQSVLNIGKAEAAQATVDKVKVEGIDNNVAVMKELLFPVVELGSRLQLLASWENPFKSVAFLIICCYALSRGWTRNMLPSAFVCSAVLVFFHRHFNKKKPLEAFRVKAPPNKNAAEQLLSLQEAIAHLEAVIQDGNVVLLKIRALLIAVLPQATEMVALFLVITAMMFAFVPLRHLILSVFLEVYTREMPYRKASSDRFRRRLREWWARIPAAPVQLIKVDENKKKK